MNNRSSLKINMILNAIKGIMGILFPLISFPYVSKILGVVNLGKYNFSSSVINYFILFAGLGISTYAISELYPLSRTFLIFSIRHFRHIPLFVPRNLTYRFFAVLALYCL